MTRLLLILFGAGMIADVLTLPLLLARGGSERNVIPAALLAVGGLALAFAVKVGVSAFGLFTAASAGGRRLGRLVLAIGAVAGCLGAASNVVP